MEASASAFTIFTRAIIGKIRSVGYSPWILRKQTFLPCAFQDLAFVDGHGLAKAERNSLDYSKSNIGGL